MYECPECKGRVAEINGLYTCTFCGLVVSQVLDYGLVKKASQARYRAKASNVLTTLLVCANTLRLTNDKCIEFFRLLKSTGIRSAEAAAITLFAVSKMEGGYVSLKRACNLLTLHGVDVSYRKSIRALLRTCGKPGFYPSPLKALEVYAKKLGLQGHVVEEAKKIIEKIKPYLGGRDPYLIALAALYIAAGGRFTYYSLSKATGRSVGRLYENVEYMKAILAKK